MSNKMVESEARTTLILSHSTSPTK